MSRQEPTQPLSLLRRTQIWLTFPVLVQRIKGALGFGVKGSTKLERLQLERDVYKAQADSLAAEKSALLSKAEHETRQMQDEHDRQIQSMKDSQLGQMNDLKAEIEATKKDAEEAEARWETKLADLAVRLATEAEENRLLRDQLRKGEQAHRDRVKDIEAHSRGMENQLEVAQRRSDELETLINAREAAQRVEIDNKPKEVSELQERVYGLQNQLDSQVALLRSALQALKASHAKSEDGAVESIVTAIEKGLPSATPPTPEQQMDHSVRLMYESRVEEMDAVYHRVAPGSIRPPKPNANRGAPIDDYDNEVAEYVSSSLKVALPRLPSGHGTGIAFQPRLTGSPAKTAVFKQPLTVPPAKTVPPFPDEGPSEPAEIAILVNYSKWKRELYSESRIDQSSIRLVEILPGSPDDKVAVRMGVHILNEIAMQYEGLSYVCGNPEPAKNIIVNKEEVPINPNLYDALISLRKRDSVRRLWIDAICINQMSLNEKSKEVQRMGQIYSRAKTVNVFLGAPLPSRSTSIDIFLKFLNRDNEGQAADRYAEEGLRAMERICKKCQTDVHDVYKGFIEVCLQPWWGRIWTLDIRQQEFYLAKEDPIFYWGSKHASNASLKRDFSLLMNSLRDFLTSENANGRGLSDLEIKMAKPIGSFKVDLERISAFISRRYRTDGFDTPRRLYRELTARATNPRDVVYGLRAIFDPVFGRVFLPDYQMGTQLLFACLAVFMIQFECWGDVLWWYPTRYAVGKDIPSWLPNFTQRNMPHELDVQPLDQAVVEKPEPELVVLNYRLHAEGYNLDKMYGHRHLDKSDGQKIFQELWQFDHCMNHNHECHDYFVNGAAPEDRWLKVFLEMYGTYYAKLTHFNSAFRGQLLQSTMKPEDGKKLPRQVAECVPCWDLLLWHALRISTPGLPDALRHGIQDASPPYLKDIFSPRMETVFRNAFANFFIGACIFDWNHLSVWLDRFPDATPWSKGNDRYWFEIRNSLLGDTEKRAKAIADAYSVYEKEISPEVMRVSWCYSFYYTFLAYVILLDCDDHASLARITRSLRTAGNNLRSIYSSTKTTQIEKIASEVPSVATRVNHYNTVVNLFRGRYLLWTEGGFRGISCPGVETCCDMKSIVAIVDGLSFPLVVREYDEKTCEGRLAGCALIRGVDMLSRDLERAALPPDYKRGKKRIFKFR